MRFTHPQSPPARAGEAVPAARRWPFRRGFNRPPDNHQRATSAIVKGTAMGRVGAEVRPETSAEATLWLRIRRAPWSLLIRRALLTLFLADVVVAEAQISPLAKTGGGADKVTASPSLVAVLLLASVGAAVLLRWQSVID